MIEVIYQTLLSHPKIQILIFFTANSHPCKTIEYLHDNLHKHIILWSVRGTANKQLEAISDDHYTYPADKQMDILYPIIVQNLTKAKNNPRLIPTFSGTVNTVAHEKGLPRHMGKATLLEMISQGMVNQIEYTSADGVQKRVLSLP